MDILVGLKTARYTDYIVVDDSVTHLLLPVTCHRPIPVHLINLIQMAIFF